METDSDKDRRKWPINTPQWRQIQTKIDIVTQPNDEKGRKTWTKVGNKGKWK